MLAEDQVIAVFKALSDTNRLCLFQLLLDSDRTNSELIGETGLSQNLLSHHLSVLADCGLISSQQSIGDARRRYYSPNLDLTALLRNWWRHHSPVAARPLPPLTPPRQVLFLCLKNSIRSLMAEALARHLAPNTLSVSSAGIERCDEIPEVMLQVLAEHNVPADRLSPQTYEAVVDKSFDYLVTVCDRVHENELPSAFERYTYIHWSLHDPLEEAGDHAGQLVATHTLYHEIEQRLAFLVRRLADEAAGT